MLACVGAGGWSFDRALAFSDHGALWGIVALIVGLMGGYGAVLSGREERRPAQPGQPGQPQGG